MRGFECWKNEPLEQTDWNLAHAVHKPLLLFFGAGYCFRAWMMWMLNMQTDMQSQKCPSVLHWSVYQCMQTVMQSFRCPWVLHWYMLICVLWLSMLYLPCCIIPMIWGNKVHTFNLIFVLKKGVLWDSRYCIEKHSQTLQLSAILTYMSLFRYPVTDCGTSIAHSLVLINIIATIQIT